MNNDDLSNLSMLDLFRIETETQTQVLTAGLLALERAPTAANQLEICMRAAHSLKGAARIVDRSAAVSVAHAMEDRFVAAQEGREPLTRPAIDQLLRGVDLLARIARASNEEAAQWTSGKAVEIESFVAGLAASEAVECGTESVVARASAEPPQSSLAVATPKPAAPTAEPEPADRVLRVTADNLNRLLGLAGESLVEARWVKPFSESLLRLKRTHADLSRDLDVLRDTLQQLPEATEARIANADAQRRLQECADQLAQRLVELEMFDRRSANLSHRLYDEALAVRMRPFADGVHGLPRMVRDAARSLGKRVRLEVHGETTQVDRDILERLEAPLTHLLRNAVDHGIELPSDRAAAGKPAEGVIQLDARHSAGRLQITIADDGRGIDWARLREKVVERKLTNAETAANLSEAELLEFLFLPGFSLRDAVTELSGRGVGLDVVQNVVKSLRGTVRVTAQRGVGMRFQLLLPLTLSVVRALLVEIGGEPYAFPLAHLQRTVKVSPTAIAQLEGRQHFEFAGRRTSLIAAHQVLELEQAKPPAGDLPVVVIEDGTHSYGLVVDRFVGERELVVQPLDARLGKVKDIAAAALNDEGAPVLIFDLEDVVRSVDKLIASGRLGSVQAGAAASAGPKRKRVLIVDDSLTVRELERKLLGAHGYDADVAVDGIDGWNAVRSGHFDLVVTDVDMPRMDGIELVQRIKRDPNLKGLPVMIVSYKDREADRQRGLEAGADYYLTKGSFHDETLLEAVVDLIGEAGG